MFAFSGFGKITQKPAGSNPGRNGEKMKAKEFTALIQRIESGETLTIYTMTRAIQISPKTLFSWCRAGREVLKNGKEDENGFFVASGRRYDFVLIGAVGIRFS